MKNRLPHLIAMLLACLMLLSSVSILAGCAKEDDPATETASGQNGTAGETSTEYVPDIAKKNYNTTFNVVAIGFNQDLLILDEDKKRDGNSLDEAVYERGVLVKEQLGVECEFADAGTGYPTPAKSQTRCKPATMPTSWCSRTSTRASPILSPPTV